MVAIAKKASANVNVAETNGLALATVMVAYAWEQAEHEEKKAGKMVRFVADICALEPDGHRAFRASLSEQLSAIALTEKATETKDSRTHGYSLASFRVMISNWRGLSEAASIGFTGKRPDGTPMTWVEALQASREMRTSHVSADGSTVQLTAAGKSLGSGRKALTDYDKAIRAIQKLDIRSMRKVQAFVNKYMQEHDAPKAAKHAAIQVPATVQ